MIGGHHVLEEVATLRHDLLGFVLSVWTLAGRYGQHSADMFLCPKRSVKVLQRQNWEPRRSV